MNFFMTFSMRDNNFRVEKNDATFNIFIQRLMGWELIKTVKAKDFQEVLRKMPKYFKEI